MNNYPHISLKREYYEKLKKLAESEHRPISNMVEVLVDKALEAKHEPTL